MKLAPLTVALVGGLLALPACGKKPEPSATDAPAYTGSKGGPPGGMLPVPSGVQLPSGGKAQTAGWGDIRLAAAREQSANNLKQIGLAMMNVESTYQAFPAGIYDKSGKAAGLSWRVAILPFIEQDNLYKMFKLDEPWDSENNKQLLPLMPKTYAAPGTAPAGFTFYRGFTGKDMLFAPPARPGQPGQFAPGVKLTQIVDGTANTAAVVEAGEAVPWTRPDAFDFDPANPLAAVGGVFDAGFHALRCDGSVVFVKKTIDAKTLRNFAVINDANVVELP